MSLQQQWSSTSLANRCRSWCWHYLHVWNSYHPCNRHPVFCNWSCHQNHHLYHQRQHNFLSIVSNYHYKQCPKSPTPPPLTKLRKNCINGLFDRLTYGRHLPLAEERRSLRACYTTGTLLRSGGAVRMSWWSRSRCFSLPAMGSTYIGSICDRFHSRCPPCRLGRARCSSTAGRGWSSRWRRRWTGRRRARGRTAPRARLSDWQPSHSCYWTGATIC